MKYHLAELHWQQFEVLSLKCLTEMVSPDIQYIDGGSDKGREMIYTGKSKEFRTDLTGKWIFQCKHKSGDIGPARSKLKSDLEKELEKVFVTNRQRADNYILITNITITGDLFDELQQIFDQFIEHNPGVCANFGLISYMNFELILKKTPEIIWQFPNILNHPDFELLFNHPFQKITHTRTKGWLKSVAEKREAFVHTGQTETAVKSLETYNIIILTGPPKSGKTFNAEMITLYYVGNEGYEAIRIEDPDEVEMFYIADKKQIFVCDDAFGAHALSYPDADDWDRKLETIFNLADPEHKFIFSSRENIYKAFKNRAKNCKPDFLPKTTIESEKLSAAEKGAILDRYCRLSKLATADQENILDREEQIVAHQNFSPETIRAFFGNPSSFDSGGAVEQLFEHLQRPDEYLKNIFDNLKPNSQAAVVSVLCAMENDYPDVQKKYAQIRDDLSINNLSSTIDEFDELDGAIIRLTKNQQIEQVDFYHPSMQEFLIREIGRDKYGKLREIILMNLNSTLINQFVVDLPVTKSSKKAQRSIEIQLGDIKLIKTGLGRLLENERVRFYNLIPFIKWLSDADTVNSKIFARDLFLELKDLVEFLHLRIFSDGVYRKLKAESSVKWMNFLLILKTLDLVTASKRPESVKNAIINLINEKKGDPEFWRIALLGNVFLEEQEFDAVTGKTWQEAFRNQLKADIYTLGGELYGKYFPDIEAYRADLKKQGKTEGKLNSGRTWYPTFLICQTKINLLKQAKGRDFNTTLLLEIGKEWDALLKVSDRAKNRHRFTVGKGWWPSLNLEV